MINYTFGILPTIMRHDARVSDFACRLYSEVDSLSNKYGYCFATNAALAKNLQKSPSQISRTLSELEGLGYVSLVVEDGYKRKIYPKRDFRDMEGVDEIAEGGTQKCVGGEAFLQRGVRKNSMTANKNNLTRKSIKKTEQEEFVEKEFSTVLLDEVDETSVEIHHVPEYFNEEQKTKRKKVAPKKEKVTDDTPDMFPFSQAQPDPTPIKGMWERYVAAYGELNKGEEPVFHKKYLKSLKTLYAILHARSLKKGIVPLDNVQPWTDFLNMFVKFLKVNPKEVYLRGRFDPIGLEAEFNKIIGLLATPPSNNGVPLFRQENFNNIDKSKFKF